MQEIAERVRVIQPKGPSAESLSETSVDFVTASILDADGFARIDLVSATVRRSEAGFLHRADARIGDVAFNMPDSP